MKKNRIIFLLILSFLFSFCSQKQNKDSEKTISEKANIQKKKTALNIDTVKKQKHVEKKLTVADYFNLLKKADLIDVPCKLQKESNGWVCKSKKDEAGFVNECETTVDIKNGYVKVEDSGTGAGFLITETALFKTAEKKDIIAVNTYFSDNILQMSSHKPKFYRFSGEHFSEITDIFPEINANVFFYKPYDLKKELIGAYFELPRYGTEIKYRLDTNFAAKREPEFQKNIKISELSFSFDKNGGKFFLK